MGIRPLAYLRTAYGAVLLAAPRALLESAARNRIDRAALVFARVLGVRQLMEALLITERGPQGRWARAGAAVDGLHAVTTLALAVAKPARRRLALANAFVAIVLAPEGLHERMQAT